MDDAGGGFPPELPASDKPGWQHLNALQRARVRRRLSALNEFAAGRISADEAAAYCEVNRSRFYAMRAAWSTQPDLASLGVKRGSGGIKGGRKRLDPAAVNALQAVLPRVVRMHRNAPVTELIALLQETAAIGRARMPGKPKLREMVERELARLNASGRAGDHLRLDCSAVNLAREGGRPWILFAVLDVGTQAVLGVTLLEEPDILRGHSLAARDALGRIAGPLCALPWATKMANLEFTAGTREDDAMRLFDALWADGLKQSQMRRPSRTRKASSVYGHYLRKTIGPKLGSLEITPDRTEDRAAVSENAKGEAWPRLDAEDFVRLQLAEHDREVVANLEAAGEASPPRDMIRALEIFAAGPDL